MIDSPSISKDKKDFIINVFIKVICLSYFMIITSMPVYSQVEKGDTNLSFITTVSSNTGDEVDDLNLTLVLGYESYVAKFLSLGIGPLLSLSFMGDDKTTIFGLNFFINYNILLGSKALPYMGILANTSLVNIDSDAFSATFTTAGVGGKVGLKYFFTERINFDFNLGYTQTLAATDGDGNSIDTMGGTLQLFAGLGIIIGKKGT